MSITSPVNFPNAGHSYANTTKPIDIDVRFTVASTDTGGKGITSLKSNGYALNVFMHTTQTPATGNPNPASGLIVVQLMGNYNLMLRHDASMVSPVSGTPLKIDNGATLTVGNVYQITTLGNATQAQWTTLGVPAGVTPKVGTTFIAIATGAGSGNTSTSRVEAMSVSGVDHIELCGGVSNLSNPAQNGGAYHIFQALAAGSLTAPADGTIINMKLRFDGSSVTVDGL